MAEAIIVILAVAVILGLLIVLGVLMCFNIASLIVAIVKKQKTLIVLQSVELFMSVVAIIALLIIYGIGGN